MIKIENISFFLLKANMPIVYQNDSRITIDLEDMEPIDSKGTAIAFHLKTPPTPVGLLISIAGGPIKLELERGETTLILSFSEEEGEWFDAHSCSHGCHHYLAAIPSGFWPGTKYIGLNGSCVDASTIIMTSFALYQESPRADLEDDQLAQAIMAVELGPEEFQDYQDFCTSLSPIPESEKESETNEKKDLSLEQEVLSLLDDLGLY